MRWRSGPRARVTFSSSESTNELLQDVTAVLVLLPVWWCAWAGACYGLARWMLNMGAGVLAMCAGVPVALFFVGGAASAVLPEHLWQAGGLVTVLLLVWAGLDLTRAADD